MANSVIDRSTALARRKAGAVIDRVGARAAAGLSDELATTRREVDALRAELARTRAELTAEIELLRAEVAGAGATSTGGSAGT